MLATLQIRNFALIDNATLEFGEGLNVLSGETGAGKSILMQALEVLAGGRGSADLIRQGEEEAEVSALFNGEEGETGLRRVISLNGKNRAYLDERPVPVSVLGERAETLLDLAGQHEHQVLLKPDRHLSLLDLYAGAEDLVAAYRSRWNEVRALTAEKQGLAARQREAREKEEFFRYQLKELEEARIRDGEEEDLAREKEILRNAVRLGEVCDRGDAWLESGEDAVSEKLSLLSREIRQASGIDSELVPAGTQVEEALCLVQEAAKLLRLRGQKIGSDPGRLQEIEDRLERIARLKKKHGGTLESLLEKEREMQSGLRLLDNFEEEIRRLEGKLEMAGRELRKGAEDISAKRRKAAQKLSRDMEEELKGLGMPSARFSFDLRKLENLCETGVDAGEFLIAPNPGEGAKPLARIASGGEVSRVFLALKRILGGARASETCVFDEVDAGIGGRVAEVVGRNLAQLAAVKQVICITHLPQVACYADRHFVIQKRVEQGRTLTRVRQIQAAQREEEIARMLAGIKITDQAMAHAREMLRSASLRH